MKREAKWYIALLLTAVYCFAAGGPAVASLLCRCMVANDRVESFCCCSLLHVDTQGEHFADGPCCSDKHSTDVALYTFAAEGMEKAVKRLHVNELPPSLAAEAPLVAVVDGADAGVRIDLADAECGLAPCVNVVGLRAPPASF